MTRSWAYNRFGVLMGTSWRASGPRWPSLRGDIWPMITLFLSQGDFCATAIEAILGAVRHLGEGIHPRQGGRGAHHPQRECRQDPDCATQCPMHDGVSSQDRPTA